MSHQATFWVLEFSESHLADRLVLLAISYRVSNDDGDAWPSITTLQREANVCERQVYDSIKKLTECGELLVREERSEKGTNRYHMPKFLAWYGTLHKMHPPAQNAGVTPAQRAVPPLHNVQRPPAQNADESSLESSKRQSSATTPSKSSQKSKPELEFRNFSRR